MSDERSELNVKRSDLPVWAWPESLDALVAAPRHHRVLLENDRVRVLDTRISPGDTVPLHTHRWPAVNHVMRWSDFVRRDADCRVLVDTRGRPPPASLPMVIWSAHEALLSTAFCKPSRVLEVSVIPMRH